VLVEEPVRNCWILVNERGFISLGELPRPWKLPSPTIRRICYWGPATCLCSVTTVSVRWRARGRWLLDATAFRAEEAILTRAGGRLSIAAARASRRHGCCLTEATRAAQ